MPPRRHPPLRLLLGRLTFLALNPPLRGASDFHFVRDYRRLVRRLKAEYPLDEAMSLAVGGGDFEETGAALARAVIETGLVEGDRVLDVGCGCGRLASGLSHAVSIAYTGVDIIPELLAYARGKCPPSYRFILNRSLALPVEDAAFDLVCAFSLFTHLMHEETYLYLQEAHRALRPGGRLVFSFQEFADPGRWPLFQDTVERARRRGQGQANVFLERSVIVLWAERLGFDAPVFTLPGEPSAKGALGQSVAVLGRP